MYSLKNDYSEGAHPRILQALLEANSSQQEGYGLDEYSLSAINKIKSHIHEEVDIHLISGGTQTNLIAISSMLRPHEACISAESGHIAVHETGAIESTGHKVITVPSDDGKLNTDMIEGVLMHHTNEHLVKPRLVYISNPTEVGTVYDKDELTKLKAYCEQKDLLLYLDGARLGAALAVKEAKLSLDHIAKSTDAFFIGATKNAALLGEALIICNDHLKTDIRYHIKQKGGLLAKGRILGLQFDVLFSDDLYFELSEHAVDTAQKLIQGIQSKGYDTLFESPTNQVFPIFDHDTIKKLEAHFGFYIWHPVDDNHSAVRLVTSWATQEDVVHQFLELI